MSGNMKKKLSIFLFIVSTIFFVMLLLISADFMINSKEFETETSGDIFGGMILISVYAIVFLIVSVLGLGCSIPSAILAQKNAIRICSYAEVVVFSMGIIFSIVQIIIFLK